MECVYTIFLKSYQIKYFALRVVYGQWNTEHKEVFFSSDVPREMSSVVEQVYRPV